MEQDLRELFKKEREQKKFTMKEGHEALFEKRLNKALPVIQQPKTSYNWLKIAAAIAIIAGLSVVVIKTNKKEPITVVDTKALPSPTPELRLGDLSPDLEKIENYYVTNINLSLSKLQVSEDTKELVDGYLERLEELNKEYLVLQQELNEYGPNDQTIAAMVQNLQLRAKLLQKLNQKLNQLNTSKNEQQNAVI